MSFLLAKVIHWILLALQFKSDLIMTSCRLLFCVACSGVDVVPDEEVAA